MLPKLLTLRNKVTSMPLSVCFSTASNIKRVHGSQTLLDPPLQHFYLNFPLIQDRLTWKTSPLVRSKFLGHFGNTLTADHMYSCHRWEKLQQQIQTLLSHKWRTFSGIFVAFLECTQNFAHFFKKDQLHSLNNLEVINPEKCGYFNARKLLF